MSEIPSSKTGLWFLLEGMSVLVLEDIISSTNVFQLLQLGHFPNHFGEEWPQLWQKKELFNLPMKNLY